MKSFLAAFVVLAAISATQAGLDRDKSIALLEKCRKKTNADKEIKSDEMFDKQKLPETPEGKCMLACVFEEQKLMKDGKVSAAAVGEFVDKHFADDPEQMEKIAQGIAYCTVHVDNKETDKCKLVYEYMKCGQEKGLKLV